jgi:hypothetical protein
MRLLASAAFSLLWISSNSTVALGQQTGGTGSVASCHVEFLKCKQEFRRVRYGFDICNYRMSKCNFNAPPGVHGAAAAIPVARSTGRAQQMLSSEPARGTLGPQRVAYVNDGSCGEGKIKKIVAGNTELRVPRKRMCVNR